MSIINITQERERVDSGQATIAQPLFLGSNTSLVFSNIQYWRSVVLVQVSQMVFLIASVTDLHYFESLLFKCGAFPELYLAITSISLPGFHQFSGIRDNRFSNPYFDILKLLPNLRNLTLQFHNAGLTVAVHHERERIRLENLGLLEESKAMRVLSPNEVGRFYKLEDCFLLQGLATLNLTCLDSELNAHFVRGAHPTQGMQHLQQWFQAGFARRGRKVQVSVCTTPVPYT